MKPKLTHFFMLWILTGLLSISAFSQTTVTIGTGTDIVRFPLGDYYVYQRSQMLFLSSEIGMAGDITHLRWYRDDIGADIGGDVEIWLKEVTESSITDDTWETPGTLVYSEAAMDLGSGDEWVEVDITDFTYGGVNNLLVSTYVQDAPYTEPHSWWRYTVTPARMVRSGEHDEDNPPDIYKTDIRPNIQFEISTGTPSVPVSDWAIYLSVFLIVGFVIFRVRKMA